MALIHSRRRVGRGNGRVLSIPLVKVDGMNDESLKVAPAERASLAGFARNASSFTSLYSHLPLLPPQTAQA